MALILKDVVIANTKGKQEKSLKVSFRGITHSLNAKTTKGEVQFHEVDWTLSSVISEYDFLDFELYHHNKVFNDRLFGELRYNLNEVDDFTKVWNVVENLLDKDGHGLEASINFNVQYTPPRKNTYIPLEISSVNLVDTGHLTSLTTSQQNLLDYEGGSLHASHESLTTSDVASINPRARFSELSISHEKEWQVRVEIHEGDMFGQVSDPVVDIFVGDKKESTSIKQQTNKPVWNENFVLEFKQNKVRFLDTVFQLKVYTGRSVARKGELIGQAEFDLWTVYKQDTHCFNKKWTVLQDVGGFSVNGLILTTVSVICEGDDIFNEKSSTSKKEQNHERLLPEGTEEPRDVYKYSVTIFKAEKVPAASGSILGSMKRALGGKHNELMDTYVEVTFGSKKLKTSVVKGKEDPEFNEVLTFKDFFPPMFKHFKIQLRDSNAIADEPIATHLIDVDDVMRADDEDSDMVSVHSFQKEEAGLVSLFGPSWIHLYGSSREYDRWAYINEGFAEGNSYRGKLLVSVVCSSINKNDMKESTKVSKTTDVAFTVTPIKKQFLLYSTIYDVSLIDRSLAEKPVMFEITMASNDPAVPEAQVDFNSNINNPKQPLLVSTDCPKMCRKFTKAYVSKISGTRKFCHLDIGTEKPSLHCTFSHMENTYRAYQATMLQKIFYFLEDQKLEMKGKREGFKVDKLRLQKVKNSLDHHFNFIIAAIKTCLNKNNEVNDLDKRIMRYRLDKFKLLNKKMYAIMEKVNDVVSLIEAYTTLEKEMATLMNDPQHSLPDVIIWMISGGKRMAYARIPAMEILHCDDDFKSGVNCGILQTVFLRSPSHSSADRYEKSIQAKMEIRMWLGYCPNNDEDQIYLTNAPRGYSLPSHEKQFPPYLIYEDLNKYTLRAHMYQARAVLGSDASGLSDPFARVLFGRYLEKTRVIPQTRTPVWDQMFTFKDITLYGDVDDVIARPPVILIDVFDEDKDDDEEFLGRTVAQPTFIQSGLYIPAELQWYPIMMGDEQVGEILAAFELFPSTAKNIPLEPSIVSRRGYAFYPIPDAVRPKMESYRVEMLFWGVREMKRLHALKVMKPQILADIAHDVKFVSDRKKHRKIRSKICPNALKNPNFPDQVLLFDVELPAMENFLPTLTLKVYEHRRFGRSYLVGTYTSNSLKDFFCTDVQKYLREKQANLSPSTLMVKDKPIKSQDQKSTKDKSHEKADTPTLKKKSADVSADGTAFNWWTRYYASIADLVDEERDQTSDEKHVLRITIFNHELEKEFNNFNDFIMSFPIHHGKHNRQVGSSENEKNKKGKIKGAVRIWKKSLLRNANMLMNGPYGTFYNLPSNDPFKILVRVYCVAAKHLFPKDFSGKADPFLVVKLGDKRISDSDNHETGTLQPEFGRLFEFEGFLPFDNLLTVQVYDWDLLPGSNDLIGETKIDIENRFYSKHRATCGLAPEYKTSGYTAWRDGVKPSTILNDLCAKDERGKPSYRENGCYIDECCPAKKDTLRREHLKNDEDKALEALHAYQNLPNGYRLVPEHIETRTLYNPQRPSLPQGEILMWVDLFPMDQMIVLPPVDIAKQKPKQYELRVIIWNCEKVPLLENSVMLGTASSDVYVRGWLEGLYDEKQKTDVHYRSTDGSAMFNWRFLFPFKYHQAKKQFVHQKKLSAFALEETEQCVPPILTLQCMEADVITADEVIGLLKIPLLKIPPYYGKPIGWTYDQYLHRKKNHDHPSLFKCQSLRGWWPFSSGDGVEEKGRVELELELVTKEEAEGNPVGIRREEPHALEKPNRPEENLRLFLGPVRTLRLLFNNFKWAALKIFIVLLLLMLVGFFFYALPGYLAKKTLSV